MKYFILQTITSLALTSALLIIPSVQAETKAVNKNEPSAPQATGSSASDLAEKLQNPVANLISVPFQNNWDFGVGSTDAMSYKVNIQPVIPFDISENWNLITRTILPVNYLESPVPGGDDVSGLGDIVQSFFLSPKEKVAGWVIGGGPVLLYPSATDDALGGEKWGAGPTAVLLKQASGWTYGALTNHIWSFAGTQSRQDISATLLQPFISYTTQKATSFGLNTESTYDWENTQWTIPLNLSVSQVLKLGSQPIQLSMGGRYYAEKPKGGPDWGLRFQLTLLFPK